MSLNNTTKHPKNFKDRTGQRFGRLTVVREAERPANGHPSKIYWQCQCDCGNVIIMDVDSLRSGNTKSCGCYRKEVLSTGHVYATKHGMTHTPEYRAWRGMRDRCHNPANKDYAGWGGRGITVCERWRASFIAFYNDMGPRPSSSRSIDRIDNDGPYSPENCRWATYSEQNNNQRTHKPRSIDRPITFLGKTQTIAQWAREAGLPYEAFRRRIVNRGWPMDKAMTTPLRLTRR